MNAVIQIIKNIVMMMKCASNQIINFMSPGLEGLVLWHYFNDYKRYGGAISTDYLFIVLKICSNMSQYVMLQYFYFFRT